MFGNRRGERKRRERGHASESQVVRERRGEKEEKKKLLEGEHTGGDSATSEAAALQSAA